MITQYASPVYPYHPPYAITCTCFVTAPTGSRILIAFVDFEFDASEAVFTVGNGHALGEFEILSRKESVAVPIHVTSLENTMWILFDDKRNDTTYRNTQDAIFYVEINSFKPVGKCRMSVKDI